VGLFKQKSVDNLGWIWCGAVSRPAKGPKATGDAMSKSRSKNEKKRSIWSIIFKLAVVAASVYLVFTFVSGQIQANAKQRELELLQARVELQTEKNEELQRMMEAGDQDAYIERMAREKLGYAKPDERVYVDITGE